MQKTLIKNRYDNTIFQIDKDENTYILYKKYFGNYSYSCTKVVEAENILSYLNYWIECYQSRIENNEYNQRIVNIYKEIKRDLKEVE